MATFWAHTSSPPPPSLHLIALDGAWCEKDGELAWEGLGHLRTSEVGEVLERLVRRMESRATSTKSTVSAGVARWVRTLARAKRARTSRVIAELVGSGLQAHDAERDRFLQLADRLTRSTSPAEQEQIKEELARLTFGD